jgi:tetratricopeptide (TPR) repeat protein
MRNILFLLALVFFSPFAFGQDADQLVKDGIALHDKGDFSGAVAKYDAAIQLQPGHALAMYEKSFSLISLKKYDDAASLLSRVLDISKDRNIRLKAYVNYGTVLDFKGDKKQSLKIYEQGIKEFPEEYLLYFNKGNTEVGMNYADDAIASFKKSVQRKPMHASSHNALGRMLADKSRIQSVLSLFSFLLIEPEGKRAEQNLDLLNKLIMKGVSRQDEKNVTINLDMGALDKKKNKEDDFSSAELMLSLLSASTPDSLKTDADKMSHKMESLIAIIDETNKKDKGFYKNFYVPFFVDLKKNDHIRTACYVAMTSSDKEDIFSWQRDNKARIEKFLEWLEGYKWAKE